ncbi:excalibur calcium-binding domain-containing protein [Acinetobacter nosocomialis]|nr:MULTISPECIES: excalibur calcium-binding domain-containing protein [Acinetobacter]SSQ42806.1 putative cold shock protein [Acinetobacter baumannii]MDI9744119.1 excalibur calcium-binding domain-containing protein [Acinetobacter nosocomialis]SSO54516.1 putative cold shock protein [Acinetobacter nosocomialis]SSP80235.1 putative cold shock protein [Acinetobacter nosocomialis]SSV65746.1 putative cold shock protein [Acinetobacter nosocomialis]
MNQRGKAKRSKFKLSPSEYISIFTVIVLVIVACVSFMVLHYRQEAQQRASHEKVQLLIQQQKKIIEAQRAALGKLPDIQLTEKTKKALAFTPERPTERVNDETSVFQCDGREYCSQMHSLEEARWFVRNCPNTKMDGDHDGELCENDSRWH